MKSLIPLVRWLLFAWGLGFRSASDSVLASVDRRATALEDVPGEGMVLSLTGQFWRLRGRGPEGPANAVVDFRVRSGALTTETRVRVPDPASRRRFARYWFVIRPFSGLIRSRVQQAARRRAEEANQ